MNVRDILSKREALTKLLEAELPVKAGFRLAKNVRLINDELIEYEKIRNDLVKKYGEEKDDTVQVKENSPEMVEFLKELEIVLDEKVDIKIKPIKLADLGEELKFPTKYMVDLIDFVIKE